jgi:hypothetical protein
MGLEATCRAKFGKQSSEGKAHAEGDHVLFRGDFRVKMSTSTLKKVKADKGVLRLEGPEGTLLLELGEQAAPKWADKILHPPTRLEKLGVKEGQRIAVLSVRDLDIVAELKAARTEVHLNKVMNADLIFLGLESTNDIKKLAGLEKSLVPNGAIWIVYPKGSPAITQNDVMAAIKTNKLVDTKVCAFSETHTALKAVVPVVLRRK